jgi:hypothetical protein
VRERADLSGIFVLPTWVFLISTYILIDNLWPRDEAAPLASRD